MIQEFEELPPILKRMADRIPFAFDWCIYKGETYFASFNTERSEKAKKPMYDMCYCATRALNNCVLFTTQFDKNKFQPSPLGMEWRNEEKNS